MPQRCISKYSDHPAPAGTCGADSACTTVLYAIDAGFCLLALGDVVLLNLLLNMFSMPHALRGHSCGSAACMRVGHHAGNRAEPDKQGEEERNAFFYSAAHLGNIASGFLSAT